MIDFCFVILEICLSVPSHYRKKAHLSACLKNTYCAFTCVTWYDLLGGTWTLCWLTNKTACMSSESQIDRTDWWELQGSIQLLVFHKKDIVAAMLHANTCSSRRNWHLETAENHFCCYQKLCFNGVCNWIEWITWDCTRIDFTRNDMVYRTKGWWEASFFTYVVYSFVWKSNTVEPAYHMPVNITLDIFKSNIES